MVNAGLCETVGLAFFFAIPRHFDFLDCETEASKHFECEREMCRLLIFERQICLRAMKMSFVFFDWRAVTYNSNCLEVAKLVWLCLN